MSHRPNYPAGPEHHWGFIPKILARTGKEWKEYSYNRLMSVVIVTDIFAVEWISSVSTDRVERSRANGHCSRDTTRHTGRPNHRNTTVELLRLRRQSQGRQAHRTQTGRQKLKNSLFCSSCHVVSHQSFPHIHKPANHAARRGAFGTVKI